ncbi:MAG TPA: hypothetical protein VF338_12055 [Leptolinea sp.]
MPKKKNLPVVELAPEPTDGKTTDSTKKPEGVSQSEEANPMEQTIAVSQTVIEGGPEKETADLKPHRSWGLLAAVAAGGILLGFLLGYFLLVKPLQDQLIISTGVQSSDFISSNQVKSDLSNTRLRQQEMEIRYLKSAAQLESANQYIFLLQMKEQVANARLMVEQKNGLEARKSLAEIKTLFEHLRPFIQVKDQSTAVELDSMIQTAIQDLSSDPEQAGSDLEDIASHLDKVEAALFQME